MESSALSLFFVRADADQGDNLDLLVWTVNAVEAEACWRKHFTAWPLPENPIFVKPIPLTGPVGVISFDSLRDERAMARCKGSTAILYWVYLKRVSGDGVHLLIRAMDEAHAVSMWRSYLNKGMTQKPTCVTPIPMHGHVGPIEWGMLTTPRLESLPVATCATE